MNIQITEIPDISNNIDNSKIFLADRVISSIKPLFDSIYIRKIKEVESFKNSINIKIESIKKEKKELTSSIEILAKKKKISTILNRISALASLGILSKDINLKNDVISILKGIDLADNATLDKYLSETVIMITKRSTSK